MIPAEVAVVACIILFITGISLTIWHNRLTKTAISLGVVAGLILGWVISASFTPRAVVDVTYHQIVRQRLPDGTTVDMISVTDEAGQTHIVNLTKALGEHIPNNGESYQVARLRYSGLSLWLQFKEYSRYQIIPLRSYNM